MQIDPKRSVASLFGEFFFFLVKHSLKVITSQFACGLLDDCHTSRGHKKNPDPLFRWNKDILFHPIKVCQLYKILYFLFSFKISSWDGAIAGIRFFTFGKPWLDQGIWTRIKMVIVWIPSQIESICSKYSNYNIY